MLTIKGAESIEELAGQLTRIGSIYVELPCGDGTTVGLWVGEHGASEHVSPTRARELLRLGLGHALEGVDDEDTHLGMMPDEMRRRLKAAKSCLV